MTLKLWRIVPFLILLLGVPPVVAKDNAKDNSKEQVKHLQQKLNTLEQDKQQADVQLKEATDQVDLAKHTAEAANRKGAALGRELKLAEQEKADLSGKLALSEKKLADVTASLQLTTDELHQLQQLKSDLDTSLTKRNQEFAACSEKNLSLHQLGEELSKKYQDKSCFGSVFKSEPLTQINRVKDENQLEEYRDKLDDQLIELTSEEREKISRQKAEAAKLADDRLARQQARKVKVDQEQIVVVKTDQQKEIDRLTRRVRGLFDDFEW